MSFTQNNNIYTKISTRYLRLSRTKLSDKGTASFEDKARDNTRH